MRSLESQGSAWGNQLRTAVVVATTMVVALSMSNCGGGGDKGGGNVTNPPAQLTLSANPSNAEVGEAVAFTVAGSSSANTITSSRIDFQGDGSWDETHSHNSSSIATNFSHVYTSAASYTARAEILEGSQSLATGSRFVTISPLTQQNVKLTVWASRGSYIGACIAVGPPATLAPQGINLNEFEGTRRSIGSFNSGATVSFTQAFRQDASRAIPGQNFQRVYSCFFEMRLYAESTSVPIGRGSCSTSSATTLDCSITMQAVVP